MIAKDSTPDDIRLELPKKKTILKRREDIVKLCRGIADQEKEYVLVISLKQTQEVSNVRIISIGGRYGTQFNVSTAFRAAILDESHGIVIVHNHPGGNVNPSKADKKCLKRLMKIGILLDIFVLESIIISGKKWQSFMPRKKK
jgi:DNA repair protein RadC